MERGVGLGFGSWVVASRGRRWIARSADRCFSLDLIYSVFKQPCSARVIQQGTFHSPNDGQAYVLFQTQAAADQAVRRIDEGCLMLPGGRDHQLSNGEIIVADISKFEMEGSYGRIISIEMFEHMKNYKELIKKISSWMNQDSLLFVHHFCHKAFAYHFEDINEDDWITIYFFSGGTMPSVNLYLYLYFQEDLPSSSSRLKAHFVGMGYSATLADKVIKEHGQRDENLILEALFGYTHARRCCCLIEIQALNLKLDDIAHHQPCFTVNHVGTVARGKQFSMHQQMEGYYRVAPSTFVAGGNVEVSLQTEWSY